MPILCRLFRRSAATPSTTGWFLRSRPDRKLRQRSASNCDAAEAVRILGPYIVHTHAKDGIHLRDCDPARVYNAFAEGGFGRLVAETGELFREVELGKGQVQWHPYLVALKECGFDGFLTIEREVGSNPDGDISNAIHFLRRELNSGI